MILIVLLLAPAIASAGSGIGVTDALADAVSGGLDKFLISIADRMYEGSYRPTGTTNSSGNMSSSEIMIYATTTHTMDPWSNVRINEFRISTLLMLVIYAVIYGAIGLIYVIVSIVSPRGASAIDEMFNRGSDFRSTRIKQYFGSLLTVVAVVGFTDIGLRMLFTLNYFAVSFLISSSMQMHTLTPTAGNIILYLFMAIFYAVLTWFMCVRDVLLYVFVAISYIIGMLLISKKTRNLGISTAYYYTGALFMQSVIVLMTTIGFIAAKAICINSGFIAGSISELLIYILLLLVLLWTATKYLLGLKRYKKTLVTAMKVV